MDFKETQNLAQSLSALLQEGIRQERKYAVKILTDAVSGIIGTKGDLVVVFSDPLSGFLQLPMDVLLASLPVYRRIHVTPETALGRLHLTKPSKPGALTRSPEIGYCAACLRPLNRTKGWYLKQGIYVTYCVDPGRKNIPSDELLVHVECISQWMHPTCVEDQWNRIPKEWKPISVGVDNIAELYHPTLNEIQANRKKR